MSTYAVTIVVLPLTSALEREEREIEFVAPNMNSARAIAHKRADEITADYAEWGWIDEPGWCCPVVQAFVDNIREVEE